MANETTHDSQLYVRIDGSWAIVDSAYVKENDVWTKKEIKDLNLSPNHLFNN